VFRLVLFRSRVFFFFFDFFYFYVFSFAQHSPQSPHASLILFLSGLFRFEFAFFKDIELNTPAFG